MKKWLLNKIDEYWWISKTETEKLKKENKIEGHKIRIESIKDKKKRKKRAKEQTKLTNKLNKIEKIKTVIKDLRTKKLIANSSDLTLIKGSTKSIFDIAEYISNRKILKKPIDPALMN